MEKCDSLLKDLNSSLDENDYENNDIFQVENIK